MKLPLMCAFTMATLCTLPLAAPQEIKITASDGADEDVFGQSVSMSGPIVIVGSKADGNGTNSGAAYIFDAFTGVELAKLIASDGQPHDFFGRSVAVSGNIAVVGSPDDADNGSYSGSAYLFDVSSGLQTHKLLPADGHPWQQFGLKVGISGSTVIVGAQEAAYVFDATTGQQVHKLLPSDSPVGEFGMAVAVDGFLAVVGAFGDDQVDLNAGSAYIFNTTTGQQLHKLLASDASAIEEFGVSVAISGTTALIGAHNDDANGSYSGSAYLFDVTTGVQLAKLLAADGAQEDLFGKSVAISGTTAIIGAPGDDDSGDRSGSAYIFDTTFGAQTAKILASDGDLYDAFGFSVAASGSTAIVGARFDDDDGNNSGSAYLFDLPSPSFGPQLLISNNAEGARCAYAEDLNGDGYADILSASDINDMIAWHENLGNGSFGERQVITTNAQDANSVFSTDLDGDGDADVLSASWADDKIAWYENDGLGGFGAQQVISSNADGATSVHSADLDGDGDMDVLSASFYDDKIAWYENLNGSFGSQQVISTNADEAHCVHSADLDGDGDMDVLSASELDSKIAWYENLGNGSFGSQSTISNTAYGAHSVYSADLNGDGFPDVLSASAQDDKVAWYENLGGGTFGAQQVITITASGARSVYATDLDADGDADVLSGSWGDSKVAWYENLGGGMFGLQQVITADAGIPTSVYATDLDGDGDSDVLFSSFTDNKIAWHQYLMGNDCNGNGVLDIEDIASGFSTDCDNNSIPDECTLAVGHGDCNLNGIYDACECLADTVADCNGNLIPDLCEGLPDCNSDGVPDECEADCNNNGTPDVCEAGNDCNANGIPDECESNNDCNSNGTPDDCEDLPDCNADGIPDECQNFEDCDNDGEPDACEIANGNDTDLNANGVPDSCECLATNYCTVSPNTAGPGVQISITGIPSISLNSLGLDAVGGPSNQPGLFFHGPGTASQPFGEGIRCVSTPIIRVGPPVFFNGAGTTSKQLDMNATALSNIQPADTRYFQLWYRDTQGGPFGFNLSNGIEITFCP